MAGLFLIGLIHLCKWSLGFCFCTRSINSSLRSLFLHQKFKFNFTEHEQPFTVSDWICLSLFLLFLSFYLNILTWFISQLDLPLLPETSVRSDSSAWSNHYHRRFGIFRQSECWSVKKALGCSLWKLCRIKMGKGNSELILQKRTEQNQFLLVRIIKL